MMASAGLVLAVFVVAGLYASVGHGGASGYLALLALAGEPPATIRPTALLLNVLVSSIALFRFAGRGHFRWPILLPFAVTAVPCAFLAGWGWSLDTRYYRAMLALVLVYAAWRLVAAGATSMEPVRAIPLRWALPLGAVIGLVSGLIGVGGGIFLSPLLIIFNWATPRQTAAVSAAFILLSSIVGLAGLLLQRGPLGIEPGPFAALAVAAVLGGLAGSTLGVARFDAILLRRMLAAVLVVAVLKMLV